MEPKLSQFGKFKILRKLGTGGMGEIFLAKHVDLPEASPPVALKRILPQYAQDPRFVKMFLREAKVIAEMGHPNLVKVLDFGKEQDTFYMTTEFVTGTSLAQVMEGAAGHPERWPLACAVEVLSQALAGIGYAHRKKGKKGEDLHIVHLDLSPQNIMIKTDGTVKILDFGVARAVYDNDHKTYNQRCGTFAYMSPEQCREEPVDPRSDLFTLGIVLYELTALRPLFGTQPSEFMILKAITEGQIPPPSNLIKTYPPELEKVVYCALEVEREKRFQSADEFQQALRKAANLYLMESGPALLARAIKELMPFSSPAAGVEAGSTAEPRPLEPEPEGAEPAAAAPGPATEKPAQSILELVAEELEEPPPQKTEKEDRPRTPTSELVVLRPADLVEGEAGSDPVTAKPEISRKPESLPLPSPVEPSARTSKPEGRIEDIILGPPQARETIPWPETDSPLPEKKAAAPAAPAPRETHAEDAAIELAEKKLIQKSQVRTVAAIYTGLLLAVLIVFMVLHHQKTGWLAETQGVDIYMPKSGKLFIQTVPEGAKVFLDKKEQPEITPTELGSLPFDQPLTVELVLPGYQSVNRNIRLTRQSPLDGILVEMERK